MINTDSVNKVMGQTMYSSDGDKIGKVGQVYLDDSTGRPEFLTVNTGLFGTNESFVPAQDAEMTNDGVRVPFTKDKVKDAPNIDVDAGHIDETQEAELYRYYGLSHGGAAGTYDDTTTTRDTTTGVAGPGTTDRGTTDRGTTDRDTAGRDTVGHDTSGPETDQAMTRSEERLDVGTTREEAGRARLRKYVVTEDETVTVPVRKERAVLESEPITDANRGEATSGPDISEEEHEVVLSEERPVVGKTTEPVERVRLGTETETQEETVTEQVRKEQIEAEGDVDRRGDRRGDV